MLFDVIMIIKFQYRKLKSLLWWMEVLSYFHLIVFWYSGLSMFFSNGYNDGGLSIINKIMDI